MSNTESKKNSIKGEKNIKKETSHKINIHLKPLYFLSFLIPIFIVLVSYIISGFEPFGARDIFTSNGNAGYITNYYKLYDFVHNSYSSSNINDLYSFYMTDPTNLIILVLPRTALLGVLSILYALKLGLASLFTTIYFEKKQTENTANSYIIIFLSVAYSLSGFMLTYGTSISYLSVIVLLPIILLFFERMIYSRKWLGFYAILSVSFILNVYTTLIVALFLCLYLLIIKYTNKKHVFDSIVFTIGAILLSILSAFFFVMPVIKTNLPFFFKEAPYNSCIIGFFDYFRRYLFLAEPSSVTNTAYGIDVYLGFLGILLVVLYFISSSFNIFRKIRVFLLVTILSIGTFMTGPNSILDLFSDKAHNSCHFSFCLIFLILTLSYEVLTNIENIKKYEVIIAGVILEGLIIASLLFSHTYISSNIFIYSIEITLLYTVVIFLILSKININKLLFKIILVIAIGEIGITYIVGSISLSKTNTTYAQSYSFNKYVVEQTYSDSSIIEYNIWDDYFNPVFNVINGYEYVICPSGSDVPDACLEFKETLGNIDIYKNLYYKEGYVFVSDDILDWTFSKTSTYPSMNTLASIVSSNNVKIFNKIDGNYKILIKEYKDEVGNKITDFDYARLQYDLSEEGDIYTNYIRPAYLGNYTVETPIIKDHFLPLYYSQYLYMDRQTYYTFDKDAFSDFCKSIHYLANGEKATSNGYIIIPGNDTPQYEVNIDGNIITPKQIDNTLWVAPVSTSNTVILEKGTTTTNIIYYIISLITILTVLLSQKSKTMVTLLKKLYNLTSKVSREYYVYIISTIIPFMIVILSCYFWSCAPFGRTSAMTSDGYVQTYPAIAGMIKNLNIKSLVPSTIGFGTLIYSSGCDPITNIISTIISLIYRGFIWTDNGQLYTTIWSAIYFVYSGPAIVFYFTHRYSGKRINKKNPILILIALLYSLSSYTIGYFIFNNFVYGLYTPIIIYALERLIYKKKPLVYIIALAFIMIRGYYSAFLLCEFLALFFITLDFINVKDFFTKTFHFVLSSILAAGLAAFNLLPSFLSTLYSPYRANDNLSSSEISNGINLFSDIIKTLSQYQVGSNGVITTSDDGMVNIYAGLLPLLFLVIYVFNMKVKLSIKIRKIAICLLYIWAFGDSIFNFIFHGFHHQSNVPNRFSIFFIFMIICIFADCIIDINEISYKRALVSLSLLSIILVSLWVIYPIHNWKSIILSIIFIISYLSILVICFAKNKSKWLFRNLIIYISTIEILLSSLITFSTSIGHMNMVLDNNLVSIGILNEKTKTDDIYISEYLTSSLDNFNMGKINGLNTFSGFNSGLSTQASDLADFWGLSVSDNTIKYMTGNPLADMMMHLKYQYIDTDDTEYSNLSIYNHINTHNNIEQYENPYFLPLGYVTDPKLQEWAESNIEDYSSFMDYQNEFSRMLCGKDLYTEIQPQEDDTESYLQSTLGQQSLYGNRDLNVELHLNDTITGKFYVFYNRRVIYIGDSKDVDNNTFFFTIPSFANENDETSAEITLALLNEDVLNELHDILAESTVNYTERNNTSISGTIDVKKSGVLYLAIPNFESTSVYVDGIKADSFDYMYGIGININEGTHVIKIQGDITNYSTGCIISIVFILIIVLYSVLYKIYNKKHQNKSLDITENEVKKENNTKNNKLIGLIKSINKTYILSFVIPLVVILISFIYSGFAPFGSRDVMTANEQGDYLIHYFELYDRFHSGKSLLGYSLYEGTGYDFTTVITYFLSDPTNALILLFSRDDIISIVNILYILKLSLSGLFMSIYLYNCNISRFINTKYKEKKSKKTDKKDLVIGGSDNAPSGLKKIMNKVNFPIVAFSLMFSISNYMLGPGLNTAMLGAVCILPLIILGMDKLVYEGKKKIYIITYFISFVLNFRITVITSIFLLLYLLLPRYKSFKHFITVLKDKLISDIIVCLGAAYIIINNCNSSFWHSELTTVDKNVVTVNIFDTIKMMTTGIKPANILLTGNNTYIYSGIIVLLFLLLYIFNNKISLSIRIRYAAVYGLLFVGFMMTSINTILNGFIYFDGISSTYAYTIIFLSIVIVYTEYKLIGKNKTISIIVPALMCSGLIVGAIFLCYSYNSPSMFIKSLEFIFFYTMIVLLYSNNSLSKWLMKLLISAVLSIELISSFIPNIKALSWLTYKYSRTIPYKEMSTLDYAHDNMSPNTVLLLNTSRSTHSPLEIALKGYSNVIWEGSDEDAYSSLELIKDNSELKIYKIIGAKNYYILDEKVKDYIYNKYSPLESMNDLSSNYLHTPITLNKVNYTELGGNYAYYMNMIYVQSEEPGDLFYNYSYVSNKNNQKAGESIEFTQYINKNRNRYIKGLYAFSKDNYEATMKELDGGYIDKLAEKLDNNNTINFNISTSSNKYMSLGLKNQRGWNIKVNNTKIKPITFLDDAMLIPIKEGDNSISIQYNPVLFYLGAIISVVTIIILITYSLISKKKYKIAKTAKDS